MSKEKKQCFACKSRATNRLKTEYPACLEHIHTYPEEPIKKEKTDRNYYDEFIKEALAVGFPDPQINFMEKWFFDQLYFEDPTNI